jgi:P-type E1-E2 ATPase
VRIILMYAIDRGGPHCCAARRVLLSTPSKSLRSSEGKQGAPDHTKRRPKPCLGHLAYRVKADLLCCCACVGTTLISEHIIARAIVVAAQERGLTLPKVEAFEALPGRGVQANVDGRQFQVGGPRLLEQAGVTLPAALDTQTRDWGGRGQTVVYLLEGQEVRAAFALADVIRPESREAIATLKQQGIQVAMLTGDSDDVARWVAS